jgi:type VI secretion system secreted protein VgrG
VLDASQNVVASYEYDEFGVETGNYTLDQPYRFSTKRYYDGIGLSYYGYRFYEAAIGRWLTRDPIGISGGLNLYGAMDNNAVNVIDTFGLAPPPYPDGPIYYVNPFGGEPIEHNPFFTLTDNNVHTAERDIIYPWTFRDMVNNNGPWDYKRRRKDWEDFGNYNFGATGAATGLFTLETLLREAGRKQCENNTSRPEWGNPDSGPPYGDEPIDQYWIRQGWNDYMRGTYGKPLEPNPLWGIPWQYWGGIYSRHR